MFRYVQAKAAKRYPCPYSFTALLNVMAAVQCFVVAVALERDWNQWKLGWNVRLLASAYTVCANEDKNRFFSFSVKDDLLILLKLCFRGFLFLE